MYGPEIGRLVVYRLMFLIACAVCIAVGAWELAWWIAGHINIGWR